VIQEKYNQLNMRALSVTKMKYFNEIYAAILALITIFGWKFSSVAGMIIMILFGTAALILTKDLKYVIPNCIYFIFMFNEGFASDSFPIPVLVFGGIFAIIIVFFSFKDGIHLKKMKSLIGLAGLAITTILPIIWCRAPKGNEVFYFLFFGNLGYLLLYLIMTNGMKENGIDLLAVSMSFLAVILACECGLRVYELKMKWPGTHILAMWYYLGWGLCNEAGILLCLSLPFVFYLLGKQEKISGMIYQNFKIIIGIVGIILTTSRGAYLFGFIEVGILYICLFFVSKKARLYQNVFMIYFLLGLIGMVCLKEPLSDVIEKVMENVFTLGFDDNGRKEIWNSAYQHWKESPLTKIFGPGMICEIQNIETAMGYQDSPTVFHSTFFETLVAGGLVGVLFLIIHFIQKYRNLKKCDLLFFITIGVGFVLVDLYGFIDNSYHMYYYMLPLMVIMGTVDSSIFFQQEPPTPNITSL
ncbi:MAG: O-antigen ligase family protein, partial [Anaeroplasmataceae bacterium]|nr:O-antigen ligase family protein [Anaeroplasmataceae bacterium]